MAGGASLATSARPLDEGIAVPLAAAAHADGDPVPFQHVGELVAGQVLAKTYRIATPLNLSPTASTQSSRERKSR